MDETITTPRERRRYRRYIVNGTAAYSADTKEITGTLLNLGWGGVLIRTRVIHARGTDLTLRFQVEGYPELLLAKARVVGTQPELMAVRFLHPPDGIDLLLRWLELENAPWTNGLDDLQSPADSSPQEDHPGVGLKRAT